MNNYGLTVAAVSTPRGKGGVAMVRVTGSEAMRVAERVFAPASGKKLSDYPANTAVHGVFSASDGEFDDGMCVFFRAPRSFTGEDTAELYCHGGLLVTKKLLEAVIEAGAAYAGPGEFTRRAFVNGKLTLTEAEAVGDMIDAVSEAHLGAGLGRLRGTLSRRVGGVYDTLRHLAASAYAYIDYPDEDLTDVPVDEMKKTLEECYGILHGLWKTSRYGRAISDGVPAAIIGRPNTGKSSLLNLLCGSERAIVTDIEGTTRDVITERVVLGDVVLRLSDTAGIRETSDTVERMGVERAYAETDGAALILFVVDGEITDEEKSIAEYIASAGKRDVTVLLSNKSDVSDRPLPELFDREIVFSAVTGRGLDELRAAVADICGYADCEGAETVITSARQAAMLKNAANAVLEARRSLDGFTQDIAGMQIEEALGFLGELDGRQASAEIVNDIFSHFCVGK